MNTFTPTARTRGKRRHERVAYDRDSVYAVLDAGVMCHVGYIIDGQPYVTPTCYWREGDRLFWHGSSASRMLRTVATGIPTCLTVTHFDGIVLARSGFHSSINYRCVMAFGVAGAVEEQVEKRKALEAFIERVTPGRSAELRPITDQELKSTTVVSMDIEEASAKIRTGPPQDDDEDYALDIWAGVLPLNQVAGPPEPDPRLRSGIGLPAYLRDFSLI